jgi:RNA polymerase sigma-70 factor (ECF subfamily)
MLWNKHEADDVAQEVFVRAYCNLKKFRGESSFYTWLYRIAVNVVYTQSKKAGRRREIYKTAQKVMTTQALPIPSPAQTAEHEELMKLVYQGLQTLDSRLREVLVLRDIEGMDTHEVAEILNIPVGTVKSRLFRAQEDLRQWMQNHSLGQQEGQS